MIHIGSPEYYAQVRMRLRDCDLILFEGVRTLSGRILSLAYRLVARRKRLDLVTQADALPLKGIAPRLVRADVSAGEFQQDWERIPWPMRLLLVVGAPIFGAYQYLTATRESIGRHMSAEDLLSCGDAHAREGSPELANAILDRRNDKLCAAIELVLADSNSAGAVGVIYGAGHMSAVTDLLMSKYRFRIVHAEWLTVFEYSGG